MIAALSVFDEHFFLRQWFLISSILWFQLRDFKLLFSLNKMVASFHTYGCSRKHCLSKYRWLGYFGPKQKSKLGHSALFNSSLCACQVFPCWSSTGRPLNFALMASAQQKWSNGCKIHKSRCPVWPIQSNLDYFKSMCTHLLCLALPSLNSRLPAWRGPSPVIWSTSELR